MSLGQSTVTSVEGKNQCALLEELQFRLAKVERSASSNAIILSNAPLDQTRKEDLATLAFRILTSFLELEPARLSKRDIIKATPAGKLSSGVINIRIELPAVVYADVLQAARSYPEPLKRFNANKAKKECMGVFAESTPYEKAERSKAVFVKGLLAKIDKPPKNVSVGNAGSLRIDNNKWVNYKIVLDQYGLSLDGFQTSSNESRRGMKRPNTDTPRELGKKKGPSNNKEGANVAI